MVNICAGPRGCDVALWATWQRHAGPRGIYYIYYLFILYIKGVFSLLTRRDREVVDFTRSRVKNITELTNLGN